MGILRTIMSFSYWEHKAHKAIIKTWPTIRNNWHLGLTAFGGPPVHFKIVPKTHPTNIT